MNPDLLDKANRIIAACEAALETCKKRTPGEWESNDTAAVFHRFGNGGEELISDCAFGPHDDRPQERSNAAFIALASRLTEPALRSTVIAIKLFSERHESLWDGRHAVSCGACKDLTAILDAWPEIK